jgi:hypothetical protein
MEQKKFDPLAWAAVSNNNAAKQNGQHKADQVTTLQECAEAHHRALDNADTKAEISAVVEELLARGANIAESYNDWWRLGCALAWELGAEGREAYHRLSAMSTKYNREECERKWRECLKVCNGKATRATIFWMAQQVGVDVAALGTRD